jgi:general secretion pathway protein B
MSFILDALKKSESERQRQSGPALFEVKVAQPRGRFAPWAVLLGALLMVNLVIVAWLALRSPRTVKAVPAVASTAPASTTVMPPPPSSPSAGGAVPAGAGSAPATQGFTAPPASAQVAVPASEPPETSAARAMSAPGDGTPEAGATADDYAPAVDPPPAGAGKPVGSATRATESGLPTYQDAAAAPGAGIPELRLDLHVFAAKPADRFVFINMVKLREGESLPQGVHVDNITPDGAILSYHGSRFVLMRE